MEYYSWVNLLIILCSSLLIRDFTCLCSDDLQDPMVSLKSVEQADSVKPTNWSTGFDVNIWQSKSMKDCVWLQGVYKICGVDVAGTQPEILCDSKTFRISTKPPVGFVESTRLKELAKRSSKT